MLSQLGDSYLCIQTEFLKLNVETKFNINGNNVVLGKTF